MPNILIDGYNLGLEKGTGVATYARNLSYELKALGHSVSVLYGNRAAPSRESLMREIAFFDSNVGDRNRLVRTLDQALWAVLGRLGHGAKDVPITGRVITRAFSARMPAFDHIYNATNVFERSQSTFEVQKTLSRVRVPQTPDLVHWTYPLPLRVKRAPNIYTMHDLVPLRLPYTTLDKKRTYYKLMQKLARTADLPFGQSYIFHVGIGMNSSHQVHIERRELLLSDFIRISYDIYKDVNFENELPGIVMRAMNFMRNNLK